MTSFSKLAALAIVSEVVYLLVALAGQSLHVEGVGNWSLLAILGLFGAAFVCYLMAIGVAQRADKLSQNRHGMPQDANCGTQNGRSVTGVKNERRLILMITFFAVLFRLTLLFTDPVAEIDIYRYLWDGQAGSHGVDPYRYSPAQVLAASDDASLPSELAQLVVERDASPEMKKILQRVHFGQLPTIYPPTSQVVFALASLTTPGNTSILHRMVIFKTWFVLFDMGTFALVVLLLRHLGRSVAWSLAYGWCPLVIKEVANSGHLDAVAIFLTTLATYLTVLACFPAATNQESPKNGDTGTRWIIILVAAMMLSLAIGAKLYPVVLVPLFLALTLRQLGWRSMVGSAATLLILTGLVMWPMVPKEELAELPAFRIPSTSDDLPPLPPPYIGTEACDPSESLRAFLGEWEMNDFIFLLLMENVRPTSSLPPEEIAWFSVVPEAWRNPIRSWIGTTTGVEPSRTPFFFSRMVTSTAFLVFAIAVAWYTGKQASATAFLESAFLTVAWFWLIQPTANPWYWTWALPMLPFVRSRVWFVLSGLVFLYYLRFWLVFHYPAPPVLGTHYDGALFFDYIVTWLEFGPWCAALLLAWLLRVKQETNATKA